MNQPLIDPFEQALSFTLRSEGGYVHDPADPGGETNFGISKRAFPMEDIRAMTRERASEIYREQYWDRAGCARLDLLVAVVHFDAAVHMGVHAAVTMLQELCGARPDGKMGDDTISRLEQFTAGRSHAIVAGQLVQVRARRLVQIERSRNRWDFIEGFMSRCVALLTYVQTL